MVMSRPRICAALMGMVLLMTLATTANAQAPDRAGVDLQAPTIETVVVLARGPSEFGGNGPPGSVVRLLSQERPLGEAKVADNGRWRVVVEEGLAPGVHRIQVSAVGNGGSPLVPGDEVRISVPTVLGEDTVVPFNGGRDESGARVEEQIRLRAEALAQAAGQAFEELVPDEAGAKAQDKSALETAKTDSGANGTSEADRGTLTVLVEWLKRSARAYQDEIVEKLTVPSPDGTMATKEDGEEITSGEAARRIAEERRAAEEAAAEKRRQDAARRAEEAAKAADAKARKDDAERRKAQELERRKAEADKRIAESLKELEKAAAEKRKPEARKEIEAEPSSTSRRVQITLEPFTLPGDRATAPADEDAEVAESDRDEIEMNTFISARAVPHARPAKAKRRHVSSRCRTGRVFKRHGRRWYRTGSDDTLWGIAKRFYGTGTAYPRIYRANRSRLSSPHIVRPCLALRLPKRCR